MLLPPEIKTRGIPLNEQEREDLARRAAQLDRYYDRIMSCRVALEAPVAHHRHGGPYGLRIEIHVPGSVLVVDRSQEEDLQSAIQAGFDAARRRLEDYARRQRGAEKTHAARPTGRVVRLFRREGFGFLETSDGREVYFEEHSVLAPGFRHLQIGAEVRFTEESGEKGPQASTVDPIHGVA